MNLEKGLFTARRAGKSALMSTPKVPRLVSAKDLFPRTRSDEELRHLVFKLAQRTSEPFRHLVSKLVGDELSETRARQRWASFVTHRRALAGALGRPVHLRVAALDLMSLEGQEHARPLVISTAAFEQLWAAATTDGLTGLANARHFRSLLTHELKQRHREPLTLASLDLDGFKGVNDRDGHAAGDRALIEVAAGLRKVARRGDVVARVGGDEFAVLFIGATVTQARGLAGRAETNLKDVLARTGMGLSFGFAQVDESETPEALLARADQSMYRTKRARKSGAGARVSDRPLVLYATARPEAYFNLHQLFAAAGVLLAPAPTPAALGALMSLLKPSMVLVNVLFPPKGGLATLDALDEKIDAALVVPRTGWRSRAGLSRPVLAADAADGVLRRLLARLAPGSPSPLVPLSSVQQAAEVMHVVAALARGTKVAHARLEVLARVVEIDLLQRALGS